MAYLKQDGTAAQDNTSSIDFVRGTRQLCLDEDASKKDTTSGKEGTEDILFAKGTGSNSKYGTIISGGVEYGIGVYYPNENLDGRSSIREFGNIKTGKTPDYFRGRTISDILDEALFRTEMSKSKELSKSKYTPTQLLKHQSLNVSEYLESLDTNNPLVITYSITTDASCVLTGFNCTLRPESDDTHIDYVADRESTASNSSDGSTKTTKYYAKFYPTQLFLDKYKTAMWGSKTIPTYVAPGYTSDGKVTSTAGRDSATSDIYHVFDTALNVTSDTIYASVSVDGQVQTFDNVTVNFSIDKGITGGGAPGDAYYNSGAATIYRLSRTSDDIDLSNTSNSSITVTAVGEIKTGFNTTDYTGGSSSNFDIDFVAPDYAKISSWDIDTDGSNKATKLRNYEDLVSASTNKDFYKLTINSASHCYISGASTATATSVTYKASSFKWTDDLGQDSNGNFIGKCSLGTPTDTIKAYAITNDDVCVANYYVDPDGLGIFPYNWEGDVLDVDEPFNAIDETPIFTFKSYVNQKQNSYLLRCYYTPTVALTVSSGSPSLEQSATPLYLSRTGKENTSTVNIKITGNLTLAAVNGLKITLSDLSSTERGYIKSATITKMYGQDAMQNITLGNVDFTGKYDPTNTDFSKSYTLNIHTSSSTDQSGKYYDYVTLDKVGDFISGVANNAEIDITLIITSKSID